MPTEHALDGLGRLFQANPASVPFLLASAVSAWAAWLVWRRREEPTAPPLLATLLAEVFWAGCEGIEALLVDPAAQVVLYSLKIASVALVAPSILIFVLEYTGTGAGTSPRFVAGVYFVPAVVIGLLATNRHHGMMFERFGETEVRGFVLMDPVYGDAFWGHMVYAYALLALSAGLLAHASTRLSGLLRVQVLMVMIGVLTPFLTNVADMMGLLPEPYRQYDLTAAVFGMTGMLGLFALNRFHLVDVAPVRFARIVQEMLDAIIVLDAGGRVVGVNRAALRLIGKDEGRVIGRGVEALPSWLGLSGRGAPEEDGAELAFEVTSGDAPGATFDVRISRMTRGRSWSQLVVIRDISEKARADAERTARIAAEQANQAKDAFLAKLSHELRTPLTPVLATVSTELDHGPVPEDLRASLELIRRNVLLEARLVDDLLDLSRITMGKLRLSLSPVDVHSVLRRAVDLCKDGIRDAGMFVVEELDASRPHVLGDATRLQQVFWNLISNACRASPPGSRLTLRTSDREGELVAIEFRDEGTGIASDHLETIFDSFAQGDPSQGRGSPGLGLGLSIGRSIVDAHGGRLVAESPGPGRGATFRVELRSVPEPAAPALPLTPTGDPSNRPGPGGDGRGACSVLLVEDNRDSLRALSRSLGRLGYSVRTADSFRSALRAAGEGGYDVLVSDLELGDGSGLDLLQQLGTDRSAPAIALTGYGTEEDRARCLSAGFDLHMVKPVVAAQLDEAIRSVLPTRGE
ncbi:hybrid sensor histidine kinase/response regulator [Tautonia plasticadhaerens]|uniref:histidine kinase n=1 Tax=Tautonia plasticadhaerens TaxID=2527974 RepID=A0A518GV59_9BACT|nr:histidine kinase N-terminal 7TM domain-containing protein [Tautonia plasticadhaerens]QDV32469.1 Aerobic respiration control sensor protein ArcB [Tautonia plasticadhaerens]